MNNVTAATVAKFELRSEVFDLKERPTEIGNAMKEHGFLASLAKNNDGHVGNFCIKHGDVVGTGLDCCEVSIPIRNMRAFLDAYRNKMKGQPHFAHSRA